MTQTRGRLLALAAGVSFGTLGMFSKLFYESGGHPFELLLIRLVGAVLFFAAVVGARRRPWPARSTVLAALGLGVFMAGLNVALLLGYERAPVALVVLLFYVYPLLATLGDTVFFREPLGLRKLAVVALGLSGIGLTLGAPSSAPALGIVLGLAAAVGTAAYILGGRHLMVRSSLAPLELLALGYLGPSVGLAVAAAIRGVDLPSASGWGYAAGLVLVGTVLASILFYAAVPVIGAGPTSLLCTVEPLVSVLLAYLVLDESLSATQLGGGALILASVVALTLPRIRWRRDTKPEAAGSTAIT